MASSRPTSRSAPNEGSCYHPPTDRPASRTPSQSSISEDSQTVMIEPLSSLEASTAGTDKEGTKDADEAQAPPNADEPRKCWICFSDETEDTPTSSEWVSPCPCALKAHQSCLLDWIADLQSPKRKKAKTVQCPQCKATIKVSQPHSFSIALVRAIQRLTGTLIWPFAISTVATTVITGLTLHGIATVRLLLEEAEFQKFVYSTGRKAPLSRVIGLPLIPVILILSRTNTGDNILPLLPLLYLATPRRGSSYEYPWTPSLWLSTLPVLRSLYFGAYRRYAVPLEKAWMREIQPRAGEDTEEGDAQPDDGNDEEGQVGGALGGGVLNMDFELGVQIEVEAVEEGVEHHHHHHVHEHNDQPPQNHQAENLEQPDNQNDNNPAEDQAQNEGAPQPQPVPPRPIIQNWFVAIPDLAQLSLGALCFPFASCSMGEILKITLPRTWVVPPTYWERRSKGILQSKFGRTLVGGCLFVVLKDALFLYSSYSMAQNHKKRKVLNYDDVYKPWYEKNIDELISGT